MKKLILPLILAFALLGCTQKRWVQQVNISKHERGHKAYAQCGSSDAEQLLERQINDELNKQGYLGKGGLLIKCKIKDMDGMTEATTKSYLYNARNQLLATFETYSWHYDFRSQKGLGASANEISDYIIYKFITKKEN